MNFKNFLIICIALLALPQFGFTQNQMGTPYSFVGLGTNYHRGDIRSLSMGNTGMATRYNMSINMINAAGLSGIDSLSFIGSVGVGLDNVSYRTSDANSQYSTAHLNHISIGFPITKWWKTALYVSPMSHVGYEAFDHDDMLLAGRTKYKYDGNGGISSFNWAHGFNITKNLALGVSGDYNFGKIDHTKTLSFPDSNFMFSSLVEQKLQLRGFSWEIGAQYYTKVSAQNTLGIGVKYGLSSSWKSDEKYTALRFLGEDPFNNTSVDTVAKWSTDNNTLELPHIIGAGLSWQYADKLILNSDVIYEDWSQYKYLNSAQYVTNRWRAAIGAEIIPESNNLSSYWKMIHYRLGFRYENLGIKFADKNIKEFAVTGGFGLPLRRSKTFVNLGFEIGQGGSIDNNLIQNRFFKVYLGISIKERWFVKNAYF